MPKLKHTAPSPGSATPLITPSELRATANELHNLLAELNDTARRIAAQIDNRYAKLDVVATEADAKIKHLEELLARVEQYALDPGDSSPANFSSPVSPNSLAAAASSAATPHSAADTDTVSTPTFSVPSVSHPPAVAAQIPVSENAKYHRIYDLADRGHSAREIAQQVHLQPGEIDLILKLRPATHN